MQIIVRNNAQLPKKFIRFIKWKLFRIQEKFQHLIYVEIYLNEEGQFPKTYTSNIRLGIPGNDIIIKNESKDLGEIYRKSTNAVHRYLNKHKTPKARNQR